MNEITEGAQNLSTYGLYTVCTALVVAIIYLFKSLRALEVKFRDYISNTSRELQDKTTKALIDSTAALKDSTAALTKIATIMERRND